jgi:hypothetical protein
MLESRRRYPLVGHFLRTSGSCANCSLTPLAQGRFTFIDNSCSPDAAFGAHPLATQEQHVALTKFTESVTIPGSPNSYAWSSASNWVSGTVPDAGDRVIIGPPTVAGALSYDDLSFATPNRLESVTLTGPTAALDIAPGVSLDIAGPLNNSGVVDVLSGGELAATRLPINNVIQDASVLAIPDFSSGSFAYQGHNASIYLSVPTPVWHGVSNTPVTNFDFGDALYLDGWVFTNSFRSYTAIVSGTTLTVDGVSQNLPPKELYQLTNFHTAAGVGPIQATVVNVTDPLTGTPDRFLQLTPVCFLSGTRIAIDEGYVAVEDLNVGDLVVTLAGGERQLRPVKWIGQRRIDLSSQLNSESLYPIRIRANAFAHEMPRRDLLLSPDHCLLVDGELIPAKLLVNGMTIVQDRAARVVHYYHVGLEEHSILIAEGLPTESYIDTGNRGFFTDADVPTTLHPGLDIDPALLNWQDRLCAPLRLRSVEIRPIWSSLVVRARAMGFDPVSTTVTNDPGICIAALGKHVHPLAVDGDRYSFVLPPGARQVRIKSRSSVPANIHPGSDDWRRLGVAITHTIVRSTDKRFVIPADDPSLLQGWYPVETGASQLWRWTNGDAVIELPKQAPQSSKFLLP